MRRPFTLIAGAGLAVLLLLGRPASAEAELGKAIAYLTAGVFEIPRAVLVGTFGGPPIVGTVAGALVGATRTVGFLLGGTLELAGTAIPLAKKAAPFVLPLAL